MKICVLSRVGRHGQHQPQVFHLGQRRLPIVAILREWDETALRCFEVRVPDGRRFRLLYDPQADRWELGAALSRI